MPAAEVGRRAAWATGLQALGVGVAVAPKAYQPRQEIAGRHPAPQVVARPWGELAEPPAGVQRAVGAVAEGPLGEQPEAACRRNRRTCCRLETPYDISDTQVAWTVEQPAERREESPQPGGAFRNARTLPRSQGSRFRTSRMGCSVLVLLCLFQQTY